MNTQEEALAVLRRAMENERDAKYPKFKIQN